MQSDIINSYVNYNVWANEMLLNFIDANYSDLLDVEVESSFKSLRKTIFHIWDAEFIWIKRIEGESIDNFPSKSFTDKTDLKLFIQNSRYFSDYIQSQHEDSLNRNVEYHNTKGLVFNNSVAEIVHHCMNHSTFHRGQIVTILRVLGASQIPSTDLITFFRNR